MQRGDDGHRAGRQGAAVAPARQSQSPPLHVPIDFNRINDMDVQAPPPEVPPWNWSGCHLRWVVCYRWFFVDFLPRNSERHQRRQTSRNVIHLFNPVNERVLEYPSIILLFIIVLSMSGYLDTPFIPSVIEQVPGCQLIVGTTIDKRMATLGCWVSFHW